MPRETRLVQALRREGLKVDWVPGWSTRGSSTFFPQGVMDHWTAGPRGAKPGARPSLNICVNGRPGIPGPLCNIYLGRDGVCTVVAAGRANHSGVGHYAGLNGATTIFGIEAEAADNSDWTPAMREAYPRLNAALLRLIGRGVGTLMGHSEFAKPRGRKIDINGYTMSLMRAQTAALLAQPAGKGVVSKSASSSSKSGAWYEVTERWVNVRTKPSVRHGKVVRTAVKGDRILEGSKKNDYWLSIGEGLWINKKAAGLKKVSGSKNSRKLDHGQWPDRKMPITEKHSWESDRAYHDLLIERLKKNDKSLTHAIQDWLKVKEDGIWGPITIKALQRKVGAKVDGVRGKETVGKEIGYLNWQIQYLTPKPPHASAKYRAWKGKIKNAGK